MELDIQPLNLPGIEAKRPLVIAGPCSAETEEQVMTTAVGLASKGVKIFRAGIWKPRTKPGGFEGNGEKALPWMHRVKEETGMLTATEVATPKHVEAALKGYNKDLCTMTVKNISRLSGITIEKNKRKGRQREKHLAIARASQNIDDPDGSWRWKHGKSPSKTTKKKEQVQEWRSANPTGTKAACVRDLGVTYVTVSKHWGSENNHRERVQAWRTENPTGTKAECARSIGLSRPTISKYW